MESRFFQLFLNWYLIAIDLLLIVGITYFFKLTKQQKSNTFFWLPFLILVFTVFYENLGGYATYNFEFNQWVNESLGNVDNPRYNVWLYNFSYKQVATILYLFLIQSWLEPSKKKYINWMVAFFIMIVAVIQLSGLEPIYLNQPIIFALGANMILVGSGLYFISLITNEQYLNSNPLRLLSFWQMTFMLFTYSLSYINSVAIGYIWNINKQLATSLYQIDRTMGIMNLSILVLIIASPHIIRILDKEPSYGSS